MLIQIKPIKQRDFKSFKELDLQLMQEMTRYIVDLQSDRERLIQEIKAIDGYSMYEIKVIDARKNK